MRVKAKRHRRRPAEQGYVLLVLAFMVALVFIGLSAELPSISGHLRRDREQELIHRGAQYARAVRRYYRKAGTYPVSIEQLENTNHIRFLRKRYKDPITGQDFRLLHFGDVQLSLKLPGMATGPGVAPGAPPSSQSSAGSSPPDSSGASSTSNATDSGKQDTSTKSSSPFVSPSQMGATGPTIGGGPVIGVASTSKKQGFHVFNKKDHYNEWEFIYDPTTDRGSLITGPYDGTQTWGTVGQVPGALTPAQMQSGTSSSPDNPAQVGNQSGTANPR